MKNSNLEEMKEIAKRKGGKCLSKEYVNSQTKLKWKCREGHAWETKPNTIQSGSWCPVCANNANKLSTEERRQYLKEMQQIAEKRGGKCLSSEYIDSKSKLKWQCKIGHVWETTPNGIKRGSWCLICSGKAKFSIEKMQQMFCTSNRDTRRIFYGNFWVTMIGSLSGFSLALIGNYLWHENLERKNIENLLINVYTETWINRDVVLEYLGHKSPGENEYPKVASVQYTRMVSVDQLEKLLNIEPKYSHSFLRLKPKYIREMIDVTQCCKNEFEKYKNQIKTLIINPKTLKRGLSDIEDLKNRILSIAYQFAIHLEMIEEDALDYLGSDKLNKIKYSAKRK